LREALTTLSTAGLSNIMTDEEIVAQLIQVKEVGRWTPEMFFVYFVLEDSVSYPLEIWA
jgi:3-methyladenine DNA glycosylase/8-oxoguanine DNA glycosylase